LKLPADHFLLQKPYGVDIKVYDYQDDTGSFEYLPDYQLQRAMNPVD